MHVKTRNVNTAFEQLVRIVGEGIAHPKFSLTPVVHNTSRNGEVYKIDEPVTITYEAPMERVLFNAARDANPFFHLYEALWMLAGRNDLEPLAFYCKQYREYSDDGSTLNGAYGYRWKHAKVSSVAVATDHPGYIDQIDEIIWELDLRPDSRRAVLSMWNVEDDLLKINKSKDVCCNTHAYFSLRHGPHGLVLDMTVCNRSNDMIWGALGANVVHFSILQEYIACCLGAVVGVYNQFTNNLHVYGNNWEPALWLKEYKPIGPITPLENLDWYQGGYRENWWVPLVFEKERFDQEVKNLVELYSQPRAILTTSYKEPFLEHVARPMFNAWNLYKGGDIGLALKAISVTAADDWREAGVAWLTRRQEKRASREFPGGKTEGHDREETTSGGQDTPSLPKGERPYSGEY